MATQFKLKRSSVAGKRPALTSVTPGELALNTYDGSLYTQRDGLGISTVTNLTPWYENAGGAFIYYGNSVGIGTTNAFYDLDVRGSIGGFDDLRAPHSDTVKTYTVTVDSKDATHRYQGQGSGNGYLIDGEFSPFIILTPGRTYRFSQNDSSNNGHPIIFYLEADKTTEYTTGVTYFADGNQGSSSAYNSAFNGATVKYTQIVVGDETPVVLHYQCYNHGYMGNSVQVNSNVVNTNYAAIIRGGLTANSAKIEDLTANRVVIAGTGGELQDSANLTFNGSLLDVDGSVDISTNLIVDGLSDLDDLRVSAGSTFLGVADFDHQIVGLATNNIIPFLFNAWSDLPSAGTYHGAFAHVHGRGKGYFAHAGAWYELVNKELNGTIGVGTEVYNIGITSVATLDVLGVSTYRGNLDINANADISGTLDVNGQTTLVGLNVAGVGTFANNIHANGNIVGDNATNITGINDISAVSASFSGNVSIGGTLTYEDVTNVDAIGIITARSGIKVLAGGINAVGVITATSYIGNAANMTGLTGASAGTYGSSTVIPVLTVNANGRITGISTAANGGGGGTGGKFVENATGIHTIGNVGIGTTTATDKLNVLGDLALDGKLRVTELRLPGNNGQFLKSTGVGVTWASFPTARTSTTVTATANQTNFPFNYNVGFLDVFVNGTKLKSTDFTATNGTSVVLAAGAFVGDTVELISYNTTATGSGGGGGGISSVEGDTSPELGGNLNLNNNNITGTGDISITGDITATSFSGNGSSLTNLNASNLASGTVAAARVATLNQDTTGNAGTFTVTANNSTDETVYPIFVDGATGSQGAETDTGLTYNPSTGALTAVSFAGSGSDLTGVRAFRNIAVSGQPNVDADTVEDTLTFVAGSNMTITTNPASDTVTFASSGGGGGTNVGITTNITGTVSVTAGSPSNLDSYTYNTNDIVFEYTVFIKNGSNYQSQKVLAMRDGTTVNYNEFAVMHSSSLLATMDVVRAGNNILLRITPETGVSGNTDFRIKREVM